MIFEIPLTSELPYYSQRTTLDGVDFTLVLKWNARAFLWSLDILDSTENEDNPVARGLALVSGWDIIAALPFDGRRPLGSIIAIDTTDGGRNADTDTLGSGVVVYYVDQDGVP